MTAHVQLSYCRCCSLPVTHTHTVADLDFLVATCTIVSEHILRYMSPCFLSTGRATITGDKGTGRVDRVRLQHLHVHMILFDILPYFLATLADQEWMRCRRYAMPSWSRFIYFCVWGHEPPGATPCSMIPSSWSDVHDTPSYPPVPNTRPEQKIFIQQPQAPTGKM